MKKLYTRAEALAAAGTVLLGLAACGNANSTDAADQNASTSKGSSSDDTKTDSGDLGLVQPGKLTVVAELGFAPFEYMEDDGTVVGFDVDLIEAIAAKMGLTANYLPNQAFDTLVPTIKQGGKADVSIAGITITDERLEDVDFTDPYLDSNQALILPSSSNLTEDDLNQAGVKVVCQSGTTGNDWIVENLPNAECVPIADVTAGLMGVQTGTYSAMVVDLPVASNLISQSFTDLKVAQEIPTGEQYGIAVSKDNPTLKDALNKALKEVEDDGTMSDLKKKWFGSDI